jgi:hypothetical protein
MAKPFDVTLKHLLDKYPLDWLRLLGIEVSGPVESIDADLATVSAAADKVFRLPKPLNRLTHLERQSSYKGDLPDRLHLGNTVLHLRHGLPVQSVAVLLRREADGPAMTGVLQKRYAPGRKYLDFRYDVLRVWKLSFESILAAGLGTLPLAPLTDDAKPKLPSIIRKMERRLASESQSQDDASIWTATYVLMGLRYSTQIAHELLRGVRTMDDSVTYQEIVSKGLARGLAKGRAEGRLEAAREMLLKLGAKRLGRPDKKTTKQIGAIDQFDQLEQLTERLFDAKSWKELLRP